MLLHTKFQALQAISDLQCASGDCNYYEGKFVNIHDKVYYFEYALCYQANHGKLSDLKMKPTLVSTEEILPSVQIELLNIEHDIVCVARKDVGVIPAGIKRALDIIQNVDEEGNDIKEAIKRVKLELENQPTFPVDVSVPDENSTAAYIVQQLRTYAGNNGLLFYNGVARLGASTNKYTKYGSSMPDVASFNPCVLATQNYSRLVYVTDDSTDNDYDNDVTEGLKGLAEFKKDKSAPKDPIGQLFAGMEKTFGDVFHRTENHQVCMNRFELFELFGFYIVPKDNNVTVCKVEIEIGKKSKAYQGFKQLTVGEAFNRLMHLMVK